MTFASPAATRRVFVSSRRMPTKRSSPSNASPKRKRTRSGKPSASKSWLSRTVQLGDCLTERAFCCERRQVADRYLEPTSALYDLRRCKSGKGARNRIGIERKIVRDAVAG